jgi:hypothetical protein
MHPSSDIGGAVGQWNRCVDSAIQWQVVTERIGQGNQQSVTT